MIFGYTVDGGRLRAAEAPEANLAALAWIDLENPTREEEKAIEAALGLEVPTPAEMHEIEVSSRIYLEDGAIFMTANLPSRFDTEEPRLAPVTFILKSGRLLTLRYHQPRTFRTFVNRAERVDVGCTGGLTVMLGLLEVVIDRVADIIEAIGREIETLSRTIFRSQPRRPGDGPDYTDVLRGLGRQGDLLAGAIDSLVTLERIIAFLSVGTVANADKDGRARLKSAARDARFLSDHATSLLQKLNFLLDATLGMISIEQNNIIKIFSVAAVVFLPPTLIASIYGMNFEVMPELHWVGGYPFAIGLMIASAVVSYWLFKSRGWL
ncbi:MAG: magnesium transporter CorA family protein [Amaricoccus sp.]|uniref:magnesium transporter CorA family protein n=1 Tax=Amaricoccus sp. TaxID=1872485 RepID=UPI0039E54E06